jgi:tetratricopeptide (TPR) repeat protein
LHFIQRALMLAEQFHHRLYQRHWGLVLGERALEEARYLDARAHYQRVMHLFDTDVPIPAFIALHIGLSKASVFLRDYQVAIEYAQTAYDGASRMIDPPLDPPIAIIDPVQAPTLARSALGLALRAAGRSDQALPHLRALVDTIPAGKPTREQIDILRGFGAALSDSGDAEGAIAVYQRALTAAAQLDDALEIALTHRDLGLIYQRADQPTQAIHEWTQALAINEKNNAYAQIARLYCDLGGARRAINGLNARALRDYEQALMALNKVDPNDLETRGLVLSNAANVYAETGDTDSADAFFSEAITIAERTGDTAAEALRNGNYGWFLVVIGRPRRAIATLERALRLSETLQLRLQAAVQTDNIGLAHDSLAEYPAAREFHEKALSRLEPSDAPYWKHSFTLNLANTLLSLNEYEQAGELLDAVLSDDAARMDADLYTRALTTRARAALLRQHITAAAEPLEQAILLARKHDFKRLLADLLFLRSQQQAALSAAAPARAAWDEAVRLYTLLHMPQAKIQPAWLSA